jgi:hypothetical protein
MVFTTSFTLVALLLSHASVTRASPVTQTVIGGPPAGIYGTNFTKSGPVDQGQTTFPKQADKDLKGDDILFQNLLSAEWIVADFYQQGVEYFNQSVFTEAGFANETMSRLTEIYQNENGHLAIFENAIPSGVTKPGKCQYDYSFQLENTSVAQAQTYMRLVSVIELGSMAYLTGLAQNSSTATGLATIMGAISAETRHLTWVNSAVLSGDPFVGPADTVYPYATQILSNIKEFIINGSCPAENPTFPVGDQLLPKLSFANTSMIQQGGFIDITFKNASNGDHSPPSLKKGDQIGVVFFHSLWNYTVPIIVDDPTVLRAQIPNITSWSGELFVTLTDQQTVHKAEDVIAGPLQIELDDPIFTSYS